MKNSTFFILTVFALTLGCVNDGTQKKHFDINEEEQTTDSTIVFADDSFDEENIGIDSIKFLSIIRNKVKPDDITNDLFERFKLHFRRNDTTSLLPAKFCVDKYRYLGTNDSIVEFYQISSKIDTFWIRTDILSDKYLHNFKRLIDDEEVMRDTVITLLNSESLKKEDFVVEYDNSQFFNVNWSDKHYVFVVSTLSLSKVYLCELIDLSSGIIYTSFINPPD